MMGPKQEAQAALFYEFSLEDHVPQDHLLRSIDRFVDLSGIRTHLAEFYSHTGRPSVDPELMIRMLLVGYCFGIPPGEPRSNLDQSFVTGVPKVRVVVFYPALATMMAQANSGAGKVFSRRNHGEDRA